MKIMNYRARTVGAALWVGPADRGGTVVRCIQPATYSRGTVAAAMRTTERDNGDTP